MPLPHKTLKLASALALATATTIALTPAAQARHRYGRALTVGVVGAHLRPGYVGLQGYAGGPPGVPVVGGIDLGLGPVFPFGGWPKTL